MRTEVLTSAAQPAAGEEREELEGFEHDRQVVIGITPSLNHGIEVGLPGLEVRVGPVLPEDHASGAFVASECFDGVRLRRAVVQYGQVFEAEQISVILEPGIKQRRSVTLHHQASHARQAISPQAAASSAPCIAASRIADGSGRKFSNLGAA